MYGAAIDVLSTGTGVKIQGCYLGTDASGGSARANGVGVLINGSGCLTGGTNPGDGDLISGNSGPGIQTQGRTNLFQGNLIGTDVHGTSPLGNGTFGILVEEAPGNVIGGSVPLARNVISANGSSAIDIDSSPSSGTVVAGNYIGTDISGTRGMGNGLFGVLIGSGATGNTVGGAASGAGNIVAFNSGCGVNVRYDTSTNNAILGNNIFANSGLGIGLGNDCQTPLTNHYPGGPITGPNNLQNYPVITSVSLGGTNTIYAALTNAPNTQYRVEFFANSTLGPSSYAQGQTFLGAANVTTDNYGVAVLSFIPPICCLTGQYITATATDTVFWNTSEFSAAVQVPTDR
jgi:titin